MARVHRVPPSWMQMFFGSVKKRSASTPPSRPTPEFLTPPNGVRKSRRNQQFTVIKEQKLRPKIDTHDYETKRGHVRRFLEGGNKVKVTIMFRGREQSRPELGFRLLQRLAEDVSDVGVVEATPKQDGRNMTMVIAPTKKPQAKRQAPARTPEPAPPA